MSGRGIYRGGTLLMNLVLMAIGVAVLVRTASAGGSALAVGYLIGGGLADRRRPAAVAPLEDCAVSG